MADNHAFDSSSPQPLTDDLPPGCEVWRRLCREPCGNGTLTGAMAFVRSIRLDTAGNRRFSGAPKVPGADAGRGSETSRSLYAQGITAPPRFMATTVCYPRWTDIVARAIAAPEA
jgi:hypothetical protein